ncbi:MAG: hypothetical protein JWO73_548 [Candidatus Taylorbacteria bacterium]|nr:hypothetical protein [Candidatus Taylorbacteria bacterium]
MNDGKIILITEDDSGLGGAILERLKQSGHHPHVIRDGAAALQEMKEIKPSLVVIDAALAPRGGYEVLEAKNKDASIARIPVILFSRSSVPVDGRRAASLGVREYIEAAPADAVAVMKAVDRHYQPTPVSVAAAAAGAAANASGKKPSALSGVTVLWVEDDRFLANILVRKFVSVGCDIVRLKSGEEAFAYLENHVPKLVLLDLLLPGMTGFDILQKMRMDPALRNIPVIILSNTSQAIDLERAKMLGAQRFLVKASTSIDEIIREGETLVR